MEKLFKSFQQIDSKRNRNLEGTGLGLAISRQLLHLMMGSINVESEFGKGSKFSFQLPQRVTSSKSSITLKEPAPTSAAGLIKDPMLHVQIRKDIRRLKIEYTQLESEAELSVVLEQQIKFLFVERPLFTDTIEKFAEDHPDITVVQIIDFYDSIEQRLPNLIVVKKPV